MLKPSSAFCSSFSCPSLVSQNLSLFLQMNLVSRLISRFSAQKAQLGTRFYYSSTIGNQSQRYSESPWKASLNQLYRRLSRIRDKNVSVVPVLDRWIQEGKSVDAALLHELIKQLRRSKRHNHALQISMWMTDKRYFVLTSRDVAFRLDLMLRVHGIEQVEDYFNNIPTKLKRLDTYATLLHCYANVRSVEKAEAVMQRMKDLGFFNSPLAYSNMLKLYYQTGNTEKVKSLMQEMDENGICCDKFSYNILLSAYAAAADIEEMEKILTRIKSGRGIFVDWDTYSIAANGYTKAGLLDKALEMLKKSEGLITGDRTNAAYDFLVTQYAAIGKKDEVLRLFELYRKRVYSKVPYGMVTSLLKFDAFESADMIFEEWESQKSNFDMRVPNYLIGVYSRKGLLEKAETLKNRVIGKGVKPNAYTWFYLATGYLQNHQGSKAVEAMKEAIIASEPRWRPTNESLAACLEYLKGKGDLKKADDFIQLLSNRNIISIDIQNRLLHHIEAGNSMSNSESVLDLVGNADHVGLFDPEKDCRGYKSS